MRKIIVVGWVVVISMAQTLSCSEKDYRKHHKIIFEYMTQEIKEGMDPSRFIKGLKSCTSWTECLYKCKRLALNDKYNPVNYNVKPSREAFEDCIALFTRIGEDPIVSDATSSCSHFLKQKQLSLDQTELRFQLISDNSYFGALRHHLLLRRGSNESWNPYVGLLDECQESLEKTPHDLEEKHLRQCCDSFLFSLERAEYSGAKALRKYFRGFSEYYKTENPRSAWDGITIKEFKDPQKIRNKRLKESCVQLFFKDKEGVYHTSLSKDCMLFLDKVEGHYSKKQKKKWFESVKSRDNLFLLKMLQSIVKQKDRQALAEGAENFLHKKKQGM